jgi:CO/xanthine dehydrogenase Mo-binding subunit
VGISLAVQQFGVHERRVWSLIDGAFRRGSRLGPGLVFARLERAQVAEVEVDPGTGQVKVKKLATVHDSGTVLNHLSYTGQIDGGVVTGIGFALMEDNSLVDGKMPTANLGEFKMATIADVPKLTTFLMEAPAGPIPYQGKAIAVHDAIGLRIYDLPITAERVYAALKK